MSLNNSIPRLYLNNFVYTKSMNDYFLKIELITLIFKNCDSYYKMLPSRDKIELSICDPKLRRIYKKYLNWKSDDILTKYKVIVPEKCNGYCQCITLSEYFHNSYLQNIILPSPNIVNHKIYELLLFKSFTEVIVNKNKTEGIVTCAIGSFRLFKEQLKIISDPDIFISEYDYRFYNDDTDGNGIKYIYDFKKCMTVHRYIFNNRIGNMFIFDIDKINYKLQLLCRRLKNNEIVDGKCLSKWKMIKRIIQIMLITFTTKNMTKLICYYV